MNLGTTLGRNWYHALKFDLEHPPPLQQYSYGFSLRESSFGQHDGERVRFLKRVEVHEVSPVLLGAGIGTRTLTLKEKLAEDMRRIEKRFHQMEAFMLKSKFDELTAHKYREIFVADWLWNTAAVLCKLAGGGFRNVRFFREARPDEKADWTLRTPISGFADPDANEIWIHAGLNGQALIDTIGHEVAHLKWPDAGHSQVYTYGQQFAAKFGTVPSWARVYTSAQDFDPYETYPDAPQASVLINCSDGFLYSKSGLYWEQKNRWRYAREE